MIGILIDMIIFFIQHIWQVALLFILVYAGTDLADHRPDMLIEGMKPILRISFIGLIITSIMKIVSDIDGKESEAVNWSRDMFLFSSIGLLIYNFYKKLKTNGTHTRR